MTKRMTIDEQTRLRLLQSELDAAEDQATRERIRKTVYQAMEGHSARHRPGGSVTAGVTLLSVSLLGLMSAAVLSHSCGDLAPAPVQILAPGVPVETEPLTERARLVARAAHEAKAQGVPVRLVAAVVTVESAWNPKARGAAGEVGLMQLMPTTARALGVNPHDPAQNLRGGVRLLRTHYETTGNWASALARYNGRGPKARAYAQRVLRTWEASK